MPEVRIHRPQPHTEKCLVTAAGGEESGGQPRGQESRTLSRALTDRPSSFTRKEEAALHISKLPSSYMLL